MPRLLFPFHIMLIEYVPACTVPVVNSIQLPVPVAFNCTQVPPLALASDWSDVPVPLLITARLSASNETVWPDDGAVTVNVTFVLCDVLPLVPVIVSVAAPTGVDAAVWTVSVEEPTEFTDVGLKLPVAPEGNPLTPNVTVPLKALMFPTFTV